jgi:hypothetical protein
MHARCAAGKGVETRKSCEPSCSPRPATLGLRLISASEGLVAPREAVGRAGHDLALLRSSLRHRLRCGRGRGRGRRRRRGRGRGRRRGRGGGRGLRHRHGALGRLVVEEALHLVRVRVRVRGRVRGRGRGRGRGRVRVRGRVGSSRRLSTSTPASLTLCASCSGVAPSKSSRVSTWCR